MAPDAVNKGFQMLRDYFALDALGVVYRGVVRFLRLGRTAQRMDENLVKSELLGRKAEVRMKTGGAFRGTVVSILRMQNAPLSRADKLLELASAQGNVGIAAEASQRRRFCGPTGNNARRDVSMTTEGEDASDADEIDAWVAYVRPKRVR